MPNKDGTPTRQELFYERRQAFDPMDPKMAIQINGNELGGTQYWNNIGQWMETYYTLVPYKLTTGYKGAPMPYNGEWIAIAFWLENNIDGFQTFLFCLESETWQAYDRETGLWRRITDLMMDAEISMFIKQEHVLGSSRAAATIAQYRAFMQTWIPFKTEEPIINLQNKHIIPFQNKVYDWKAGKFRAARIYDFIFSNIPHDYEEGHDCPIIKQCLMNCVEQDIAKKTLFIHAIMGFFSSLLQGYNLNQWILMLISQQGGVGKGTLMRLISHILGRGNVVEVDDDTLLNPASRDAILGKRLILISETGDELKSLPIIKRISGGDTIPLNPKYHKAIDYLPLGQVVITTNEKIKIGAKEVALWRRPMLVNMTDKPFWTLEEYEQNVAVMFSEGEIQGFLELLIKYIGKQKEIFRQYKATFNAEILWEDSITDLEYEFFDDCLKKDPQGRYNASFFVEKFLQWLKVHEIEPTVEQKKPLYVRKFNKMLGAWARGKGYKDALKVKGNKCSVWTGLVYSSENVDLVSAEKMVEAAEAAEKKEIAEASQ